MTYAHVLPGSRALIFELNMHRVQLAQGMQSMKWAITLLAFPRAPQKGQPQMNSPVPGFSSKLGRVLGEGRETQKGPHTGPRSFAQG